MALAGTWAMYGVGINSREVVDRIAKNNQLGIKRLAWELRLIGQNKENHPPGSTLLLLSCSKGFYSVLMTSNCMNFFPLAIVDDGYWTDIELISSCFLMRLPVDL